MATKSISFIADDIQLLADIAWMPIAKGERIHFTASGGIAPVLHFSPDLLGILDPAPTSPLPLGSGSPAEFTLTSHAPGVYRVFVAKTPDAKPDFTGTPSAHLFFHSIATASEPIPAADIAVPLPPPPPPPECINPAFSGTLPPVQSGN
jgi:hypothetical protein